MNNNDSNLSFFNLCMTLDRSGQAVHPGPIIRLSYRLTGSRLELYILCAHTRLTSIWSSTLKILLMLSFHPFLFLAVMGFHIAHAACIKTKQKKTQNTPVWETGVMVIYELVQWIWNFFFFLALMLEKESLPTLFRTISTTAELYNHWETLWCSVAAGEKHTTTEGRW